MNLAVFVWTFNGVCEAVALGVVVLILALFGLISLAEWWSRRKPERRKKHP